MFSWNQLTELLELAHADRFCLRGFGAGIDRHDVAELLTRRKFSRSAMSREEHEHPIVLADLAGVGHLIAERPDDSFARRILVQKLDDVVLLEPVLIDQHLF